MAFGSSRVLAVYGEFDIPFKSNNQVKRIEKEDKKSFIDSMDQTCPGLLKKHGVYIFCIRTSGGTKPWYVGQTRRSLAEEILDADKLVKYNKVLFGRKRGVPCFYFLTPKKRNVKRVSTTYLPVIEEFCIATAKERNPELINEKSTSSFGWCIDGIMGGDGEERDLEPHEEVFCKIMGIKADRKEANENSNSE